MLEHETDSIVDIYSIDNPEGKTLGELVVWAQNLAAEYGTETVILGLSVEGSEAIADLAIPIPNHALQRPIGVTLHE